MLVKDSFNQSVKVFMNKQIPKLYVNSTLRDAMAFFQKNKLKLLPVVDQHDSLLGVMTHSSLFKALLEDIPLDANILPYIIHDAVTVNTEDNLYDVRIFLIKSRVGHAVVLSEQNKVCGILDTSSIIQAYESKAGSLFNSLESLIEYMQTGILAVDRSGVVVVVNQAAESMCSISKENSTGLHYSEILPQLHTSLSEFHSSDIPLHRITVNKKKLLITYKSLSNESTDWGGIILIQDLTDYEHIANELEVTKKLERTLQTVLDTTYDGHIVIDLKGKIEMINEAACEFIRKPEDKLIGHHVAEVIPEIKLEEALAYDFQGEKLEAMVIGQRRCLIKKIPVFRDKKHVGAIAKIIYQNLNKWKSVISRLDYLEKEVSYFRGELSLIGGTAFDLEDILTVSEEMDKVKRLARQSAPGFSNVLLLGESGTGKELFARGIHAASNRSGSFIKVNCAAIPAELWESEFFGYEDGAFTGAKRGGKPGKFELANNGTLFLDEIGDMPLAMQVKLLRVLQEREFERVGGTKTIRVNVRIIAATNKEMEQMVANNEFREDLYYRLNVIAVRIPPLRDRLEDVPLLATSITKKFSHLMGLGQIKISDSAMMSLASHTWPGNVRELENAIERAMNCIHGNTLEKEHLPEYIQKPKSISRLATPAPQVDTTILEAEVSDFYQQNKLKAEKDAIEMALRQTDGNRSAAAKLLGISRSQFYKKIKKFQ